MTKASKSSSKASVVKKTTNAKTTVSSKKGGGTTATRIMEAIASQMAMGKDNAERSVVQGLAAMPNVKSFSTTILNMKNKGLVEYDSKTIWLTQDGIDKVGPDACAKPQSNEGMQEKMKENIKQKKSREIFDILTDGRAYTRKELADKMGLELNKSFGTYMSALSKVTEKVDGNKVRLIDMAFPIGRSCDE